MGIARLGHYAIRTRDFDASLDFYTRVLGFRAGYRPPFPFPGAWLYADADESDFGVVHLIDADDAGGLRAYLGARGGAAAGSGAVDHVAFLAEGWPAMRARCDAEGLRYSLRAVPELGLLQVFLTDPSGVVVELNYPAAEAG
jgi:catechol 2,3-dioxygenase-like lactoylglutathione lyase family enzyme